MAWPAVHCLVVFFCAYINDCSPLEQQKLTAQNALRNSDRPTTCSYQHEPHMKNHFNHAQFQILHVLFREEPLLHKINKILTIKILSNQSVWYYCMTVVCVSCFLHGIDLDKEI